MNNITQLVSIIVPIYNVEAFLQECLDSIINQSYKNIEIILVDDGSPDNCGQICEEYAKSDSRIKVLHKVNGGLADARNAGIDLATGGYICFVDSDDVIDQDYILDMLNVAVTHNSQIVICKLSSKNNELGLGSRKISVFDPVEFLNNLYESNYRQRNIISCNKLYALEVFNNIRYDLGKLHEDEFIIHKLLFAARKIATVDRILYYYRKREGSITSNYSQKRFNDVIEAFQNRIDFAKRNSLKKFENLTIKQFHIYVLNSYLFNELEPSTLIKDVFSKNILQKDFSIKSKLIIFLKLYVPFIRPYINKILINKNG